MRYQSNFSSSKGIEIPRQGEYHLLPTEFLTHIHNNSVNTHKPFLISAAAADKIVNGIAIISLFCALFLIGLNA